MARNALMAMNDAHYNVMNMIDINIRATDAHGYLAAGYLECVADVIISGQMTALTASDPFVVLSLHHFMQYNSYHYWQYVERMLAGEADRSVTTLMGKMGLASLLETAGFDFRGLITYDEYERLLTERRAQPRRYAAVIQVFSGMYRVIHHVAVAWHNTGAEVGGLNFWE